MAFKDYCAIADKDKQENKEKKVISDDTYAIIEAIYLLIKSINNKYG